MYLRENQVESYENLINFEDFDEYKFYDIAKINQKDYPVTYNDLSNTEKGSLYQTVLYRDNSQVLHERAVYGFLDLLGDLGGVMEIILLCFGIFLSPLSEFAFTLKSI